ncbi:hypothetical protein [Flavobacterium sp.]|uniref:AAA family ATPase n=1 Tax=Flavobacterium sp. TaxID=239 RepID=UPI0026181938|nr:hypothetical protein [Flavobacterium sp.]
MKNENNFKLIAIRPLVGCKNRFLKNLIPGQIYKFYNDYNFYDEKDNLVENKNIVKFDKQGNKLNVKVSKVRHFQNVPTNIYKINKGTENEKELNISAIVGKNGAGKSSVLELLYALCYVIATKKDIINDKTYYSKKFKETEDTFFKDIVEDVTETIEGLEVELYYSKGNEIFCLKNNMSKLELNKFQNENWVPIEFTFDEFFYNIVINYSIYGLNSSQNNRWLNPLFHKNDGYKTPIVINPYRDRGNIDINSEFHLAQTRVLANIIDDSYNDNYIINEKKLVKLEFDIYPEKLDVYDPYSFNNVYDAYEKENNENVIYFFKKLLKEIINYDLEKDKIDILEKLLIEDLSLGTKAEKYRYNDDEKSVNYDIILYQIMKYTIKKIYKICRNYDEYKEFNKEFSKSFPVPKIVNVDELIKLIKKDKSHITLKVLQILYTVKEEYFKDNWEVVRNPENSNHKIYRFKIDIEPFKSIIKQSKKSNSIKVSLKELIPVAFFRPKLFVVNNDKFISSSSSFGVLSSGEQQLVHSIQSILYHLINLNSVFKSSKKGKIKYSNVNIILDEVELYYHPEYQRQFIYELIKGIENINIEKIRGINILFSTHSPFILSDIPHQNTLRIKEGKPYLFQNLDKTFGANIHDLLDNDFFLEKGFMGEWAKIKIQSLIEYLDEKESSLNFNDWEKENSLSFIEIIGEPVLRNALRDMYYKKFDDEIENEITRLRLLQKNKLK